MCYLMSKPTQKKYKSFQQAIFWKWWYVKYQIYQYVQCGRRNIYSISQEICTRILLCCAFLVIHWRISPYPSGLLQWHCGNLTIAPVPAKQPWWIWINTSCEFIMNDCITTTKQSTTKPCAYFLGYTVLDQICRWSKTWQHGFSSGEAFYWNWDDTMTKYIWNI